MWANIFIGREQTVKGPLAGSAGFDRKAMVKAAEADLERTHIRIGSVNSLAGRLSGGQRQAIAVGRAVAWGSRVLLLDEPTAALGVEQQAKVGELVRTVCDQGVPILLISHNLPQVHALCDRVAVLFQGKIVADLKPSECSVEEIVSWITGASLAATTATVGQLSRSGSQMALKSPPPPSPPRARSLRTPGRRANPPTVPPGWGRSTR